MPEKKPKLITFNRANTELLKEHIKRFREKLGLNIENIPIEEPKQPKIEENKVSVAAEQKPKTLVNIYGRAYAPHIGWGKSVMEDGGNI